MSLQVSLAFRGDLEGFADRTHAAIARGARNAVEKQAARAKLQLRQDTRSALGDRVANAWRANIYPKSKASLAPAVFVYTNAPKIIRAFSESTTIRAKHGAYMAIPTENTPRKGRRYATPLEVEGMFNQDLIIFPGRGQQLLAFVNVVAARSGKGFRRSTARRQSAGRKEKLVLMFVLVRQVGLKQRLNTEKIFHDLREGWAELFPAEINAALAGDR
jgi:hypothetical protein